MSAQNKLPGSTIGFLFFVAFIADGAKILLDLLFGVGVILDPFFITPVAAGIFWFTLDQYDVPMLSGKNAGAGWVNLIVSLTPIVDMIPDWTLYTLLLLIYNSD